MAKKDVLEYRTELQEDLTEMVDVLNDMEINAMKSLVPPSQLEQTKATVEEMKKNIARVDWIIFLLNKPSKFEEFIIKLGLKKDPTEKLDKAHSPSSVRDENKKLIDKVKSLISK